MSDVRRKMLYEKIKLDLLNFMKDKLNFVQIKSLFRDQLSARRLDYLHNESMLFDVLERQCIISSDNVHGFRVIVNHFMDPHLIALINIYETSLQSDDNFSKFNRYGCEIIFRKLLSIFNYNYNIPIAAQDRLNRPNLLAEEEARALLKSGNVKSNSANNNAIRNPSAPPCGNQHRNYESAIPIYNNITSPINLNAGLNEQKQNKVKETIAKEIGRKWRDFGRGLEIREGEMDEMETKYPNNLKSRIFEMFTLIEEREDPREIVTLICTALTSARRNDLRRKIEQILAR